MDMILDTMDRRDFEDGILLKLVCIKKNHRHEYTCNVLLHGRLSPASFKYNEFAPTKHNIAACVCWAAWNRSPNEYRLMKDIVFSHWFPKCSNIFAVFVS